MRIAILSIGFLSIAAAAFAQAPAGPSSAAPSGDDAHDHGIPRRRSIPLKYTQAGEQVSPALNWTNAPAGTQSFVLHMHDLDVARNKTTDDQVHWLVWNIPGTATGLPEGVPKGRSSRTAATRPARAARCIAAPARRRPARCITTRSRSSRSTRSSTSRPAPTRSRRGRRDEGDAGPHLGKAVYIGLFRGRSKTCQRSSQIRCSGNGTASNGSAAASWSSLNERTGM